MPERWIEKSNIKYQHFFALIMGGGGNHIFTAYGESADQ